MAKRSGWWALLLLPLLFAFRPGLYVLRRQRVRVDPSGDGHFGSTRTGHVHEGLDLLVDPGEPVFSPVAGEVVGLGYAYRNDRTFRVVAIEGDGIRWDLMYVMPARDLFIGAHVLPGEVVGYAQNIVDRYGPPMLPHIHIETRRDGALFDPASVLSLETSA